MWVAEPKEQKEKPRKITEHGSEDQWWLTVPARLLEPSTKGFS
jgi:hypothetical protein